MKAIVLSPLVNTHYNTLFSSVVSGLAGLVMLCSLSALNETENLPNLNEQLMKRQ